jgi:DNA-binding transcriptional ArsR family regulator
MAHDDQSITDLMKALGDPIRWDIVRQMASQKSVAASELEDRLPIAKPTISYHVKILAQAGLAHIHKQGRNYYYSLRHEALTEALDALAGLLGSAPSAPPAPPSTGDDVTRPEHTERLVTW